MGSSKRENLKQRIVELESELQKLQKEKASLVESEQQYRIFFQNSTEGIWRFELTEPVPVDLATDKIIKQAFENAILTDCNDTMAQMYGLEKRDDIIGTPLKELLVPSEEKNVAYLREFIENDFRLVDGVSYEPDQQGRTHIFLNNLIGIVKDKHLRGAWGVQRDITEQVGIEKALKNSRERLSTLMDNLPGIVYQCENDKNWTMFFLSKGFKEITGYDPHNFLHNRKYTYNDIIHPDDRQKVWSQIQQSLDRHTAFEIDYRIIDKNQVLHYVSERGRGSYDKEENVRFLEGFIFDVTERKKVNQRLKYLHEIYRQAIENANAVPYRLNYQDKRYEYVGDNCADIFEIPAARMTVEFLKESIAEIHPHDSKYRQCPAHYGKAFFNKEIRRYQADLLIKTPSGKKKWVSDYAVPIYDEKTDQVIGSLGILNDITGRKQAESRIKSLSQQIERFSRTSANILTIEEGERLFAEISSAIVEISDFNRVLFYVFVPDPPYRRVLGYRGIDKEKVTEMLKREVDKETFVRLFKQGIRLGEQSCYIPHNMKDILDGITVDYGKRKYVPGESAWHREDNLLVALKDKAGGFIGMLSVDDSKSGFQPTNETVRPLEIFANHISQILLMRQVENEREEMKGRLMQAERIKALGEMAGGVAHDFNNILSVILGQTQLLRMKVSDQELVTDLELIEKAADDAAETVKRIQEFTRIRTDKDLVPVSLNEVLEDAVQFTKNRWKDEAEGKGIKIKIDKKFQGEYYIKGNISELRELFTNIIVNALDAMPKGGDLKFELTEQPGKVRVAVRDSGIGMSTETVQRVFDPFFTTKGAKGTGLGLSVGYGIVKRHGGKIDVQSERGKGTCIRVDFPKFKTSETSTQPSLKQPKGGNKTSTKILIIDDDRGPRKMLHEICKIDNHDVLVADSGKAGLKLFKAHPDIKIVFTDLGMPEMSGWEVTEQIRKVNPHTVVVMVTGWGNQIVKKEARGKGVDEIITKPFQVDQILRLIGDCMEPGKQQGSR